MKRYRVYNIEWDVDCENDLADLPKEMIIEDKNDLTNENYKLSDFISDEITEQTNFCHRGCNFELIDDTYMGKPIMIDTETFGKIYCTPCIDADSNEKYFDLYDEEERYYGKLHGVTEDEITSEMLEEQIEENLYY